MTVIIPEPYWMNILVCKGAVAYRRFKLLSIEPPFDYGVVRERGNCCGVSLLRENKQYFRYSLYLRDLRGRGENSDGVALRELHRNVFSDRSPMHEQPVTVIDLQTQFLEQKIGIQSVVLLSNRPKLYLNDHQ